MGTIVGNHRWEPSFVYELRWLGTIVPNHRSYTWGLKTCLKTYLESLREGDVACIGLRRLVVSVALHLYAPVQCTAVTVRFLEGKGGQFGAMKVAFIGKKGRNLEVIRKGKICAN